MQMNDREINVPDSLIKWSKENNVQNVLIGNGYCLSHPDLSSAFEWSIEKVFDIEDIIRCFIQIPIKSNCPETDLGNIRKNIIKKILKYYTDRFVEILKNEDATSLYKLYNDSRKYSSIDFISCFKNIFTVNYDPLIYLEILIAMQECVNNRFIDGLRGPDLIEQKDIVQNIKYGVNSKIFYYLHGSWLIQANNDDHLRKLPIGEKIPCNINKIFDQLFIDSYRPFIIMEDRWQVKKMWMKWHPYWKKCIDLLQSLNGDLFVFGMSLSKDDHILEFLSRRNNKIYISYIDDSEKDKIINKVKAIPQLFYKYMQSDLQFIKVGNNVIWKETPTKKQEN
jgi:hypothetical protein